MPVVPHRLDPENTRPLWWKRQAALPAAFQTSVPAAPADDPTGPAPVPAPAPTTSSKAPIASTSTSRSTTPATSRATTTSSLPRPTVITSSTKITSSSTASNIKTSSPKTSPSGTNSETGPHSYIFPNSFPPDFPVHTAKETHRVSGGRGYAFLKNNELADSMLIFAAFLVVSLIASIILIKATQIRSRRQGSKVDQMVGEDMKWQERREVLERKIIWEGSGAGGGGRGGRKLKSAPGKSKMGPGYRGVGEPERRR